MSVVLVAVKVAAPFVDDFTVKVATPDTDVAVAGAMVSVAPRLEARLTTFPEIRFEFASFKVTVMVLVVEPSASTEVALAETVEVAILIAPAVTVKVGLVVKFPVPLKLARIEFAVPAVVAVNVATYVPSLPKTEVMAPIVPLLVPLA